jgi:hypothetical protein
MEKFCQNPLCESRAVKEVPVSVEKPSDQIRALCAACDEAYTWGVQQGKSVSKGLKVDPPPEEDGQEPLYRVVYAIDVNAADAHQAAECAYEIMSDPDSMRPVLQVIDSKGHGTEVDLSEDHASLEDSVKTANYDAAAQYLADHGRQIFTGPMIGGLWNGRCLDAYAMSLKQGDKAAYEFLLKFGDQYASGLSADQQGQWQVIKERAAGLLKEGRENTSGI